MSGIDPIIPEPQWERPMPHLTDDDVYELDEDEFNEDLFDEEFECEECGESLDLDFLQESRTCASYGRDL